MIFHSYSHYQRVEIFEKSAGHSGTCFFFHLPKPQLLETWEVIQVSTWQHGGTVFSIQDLVEVAGNDSNDHGTFVSTDNSISHIDGLFASILGKPIHFLKKKSLMFVNYLPKLVSSIAWSSSILCHLFHILRPHFKTPIMFWGFWGTFEPEVLIN